MRLLVLGKDGQVGRELQRSLGSYDQIVALGRDEANLEDPVQLRQAVLGARPDCIVNAAAYTAVDKAESEPERADRINHLAVAELGAIAKQMGCWLVHYSTDYVFDGTKQGPYVETDQPNPLGFYGKSKRDGERALELSGCRFLILRTSWVHAGRGQNFIATILRLAAERSVLKVVADQIGAPTSAHLVADVTAQCVEGMHTGDMSPGVYHLAASGETNWHRFAQFIVAEAAALGSEFRLSPDAITPITSSEYPTAAKRPANSRLGTGKIQSALDMTIPNWETGARQTIQEITERPFQ